MTATDDGDSIRIRPASPEDYDGIVALWRSSGLTFCHEGRESREAFCRQLEHFADLYLVALDGEKIIGAVLGSHDHRKGWINRLAVLPEHRRQGIAGRLVSVCEATIQAHGIEIISALVEPGNETSFAFFEEMGYRNDVPARYYRKLDRPGA